MTSYTCTPEKADLVLDHACDFTMRKVGRKRHARLGERFGLDLGPPEAPFATALCVFRARAILGPDGLLRLLDPAFTERGEPLHRLFAAAEQGAYHAEQSLPFLATRDGFADYPALFAWHEAYQGGGRKKTLLREVIGWTDVEPTKRAKKVRG